MLLQLISHVFFSKYCYRKLTVAYVAHTTFLLDDFFSEKHFFELRKLRLAEHVCRNIQLHTLTPTRDFILSPAL